MKCEIQGKVDGKRRLADKSRHTVVTSLCSQNGWLKAWNKYCGIAVDGEEWCDVRHGRLIVAPGGMVKNQNQNQSVHLFDPYTIYIIAILT